MDNIKYTRVEFGKTYNLGNYENERISLTAEVPEGSNMLDVFTKIRQDVEAAHNYHIDFKAFKRAEDIVADARNHYGHEVERAKASIDAFYVKYPFHTPGDHNAALQLEGAVREHKDAKKDWTEDVY